MSSEDRTVEPDASNPPSPAPRPTAPPPGQPALSVERKRLVLSTLAAAGIFNLTAWELQAHGNRSTHKIPSVCDPGRASNIAFTPDDYVAMRQSALEPGTPATQELMQVRSDLASLEQQGAEAVKSPQYTALLSKRQGLEKVLRMRAGSRQVLDLLEAGDAAAAVAVIEGRGDAQRVMHEYGWVMQDIVQIDRKGLAITPAEVVRVGPIAVAAAAYADRSLAQADAAPDAADSLALRAGAADLLFNVASFLSPDHAAPEDHVTEYLQLAATSARRALEVRVKLQPALFEAAQTPAEVDAAWSVRTEIAHALWKVGFVAFASNDMPTAADYFQRALDKAGEISDRHAAVWSKIYLAAALRQSDPARAAQLTTEGVAEAPTVTSSGVPGEKSTLPWLLKHLP